MPYNVVDWYPANKRANKTVAESIEAVLNEAARGGWELHQFEELEEGGRRFYLKKSI